MVIYEVFHLFNGLFNIKNRYFQPSQQGFQQQVVKISITECIFTDQLTIIPVEMTIEKECLLKNDKGR